MSKNVFVGVASSKPKKYDKETSFNCGAETAKKAIKNMVERGGSKPDFAIVFSSSKFDINSLVDGINSVFINYPKIKWIGCTTNANITPEGILLGSVSVCVISSEYLKFGVGVAENVFKEKENAGRKCAEMSIKDIEIDRYVDAYFRYISTKKKNVNEIIKQRDFAMLVLTPGFTMKNSGVEAWVIEGMKSVVGNNTTIVGGSSSDDFRFIKSYQFINGKIFTESVVCASIFSNLKLDYGLSHGYSPTKKVVLVTKSKNQIVYEINGNPAIEEYARLLGTTKEELSKGFGFMGVGKRMPTVVLEFLSNKGFVQPEKLMKEMPFLKYVLKKPFAIPDTHGNYLLKVPTSIHEKTALEFASNIPKNLSMVLMESNLNKMVQATNHSVKESLDNSKKPAVLFVFECAGRYIAMGGSVSKALYFVKKTLKNTPFIGFYTNSEIGQVKEGVCDAQMYSCSTLSVNDNLVTE